VTYQISRGTSRFLNSPLEPDYPWLVEKVLDPGESYLIGSFIHYEDAVKCLHSLRSSMEVARGALVTEAA
jgi:hypothetical protein